MAPLPDVWPPAAIRFRADDGAIELTLGNVHYHCPPEHGGGEPGQFGVPTCLGASEQNLPPPAPASAPPSALAPTRQPVPGDVVEIHYVYGWDGGPSPATPARDWVSIRRKAAESSLSDCQQPLVVVAVWARVTRGAEPRPPHPLDASPFLPGAATEYPGSTTGSSAGAAPAYWRLNLACSTVEVDDLDLDGMQRGKIKGHPSRPLQPPRT